MQEVKCKNCRKKFFVKPSQIKYGGGKYCSMKCSRTGQIKGKMVACKICGKETWKTPKDFKRSKSGKFFCSKSCQTKWRNNFFSGENHPFWKGGEYTYKNKLLKSGVKRVCKKCGLKDERVLEAHHIDKDRKNSNIENLIWLCRNCHYLAHGYDENF